MGNSIFDLLLNNYQKPAWENYLENTPDWKLKETGLSREKLHQVLSVLHDLRIIN